MNITKNWLIKKNACKDGLSWFLSQKEKDVSVIGKKLVKENRFDWANWVLTEKMNKSQCVKYAIYAAKKVLYIFEEKYPKDKRPRKAIEAAEKYLKNKTKKNRYAYAVYAAAASVSAASASAASYAAASAYAAHAGAAVSASAYVTYASAYAASAATHAATEKKLKTQIISYGLKILGAVN